MFIFFIFLSLFFGGVVGQQKYVEISGIFGSCDFSACITPEDHREFIIMAAQKYLPQRLDNLCRLAVPISRCLSKEIDRCTAAEDLKLVKYIGETRTMEANDIIENMKAIQGVVNDACDVNHPLHSDLESFDCTMDDFIEDFSECQQEANVSRSKFIKRKHFQGRLVEGAWENKCLLVAFTFACCTERMADTCGDKARDTFNAMFKRLTTDVFDLSDGKPSDKTLELWCGLDLNAYDEKVL